VAKKKEPAEGAENEEKKGGGKLKLIAMVLPTLLLVAGGVYFFVLAPKSSSAAATPKASSTASSDASGESGSDDPSGDSPEPSSTYKPGKVVSVDPVTVNLANGHFLKVGLGLQQTAAVTEDVSPAPAVDALITEFSGKTVSELSSQAGRDAAKKELTKKVSKAYEGEVYKIFYNSFVMN
jgi:flagellar FliL protein